MPRLLLGDGLRRTFFVQHRTVFAILPDVSQFYHGREIFLRPARPFRRTAEFLSLDYLHHLSYHHLVNNWMSHWPQSIIWQSHYPWSTFSCNNYRYHVAYYITLQFHFPNSCWHFNFLWWIEGFSRSITCIVLYCIISSSIIYIIIGEIHRPDFEARTDQDTTGPGDQLSSQNIEY